MVHGRPPGPRNPGRGRALHGRARRVAHDRDRLLARGARLAPGRRHRPHPRRRRRLSSVGLHAARARDLAPPSAVTCRIAGAPWPYLPGVGRSPWPPAPAVRRARGRSRVDRGADDRPCGALIVAQPSGEPTGRYVGQFLGAESVLLLSVGLVLISMLPWVEEWFDGIDRAAIWHRRVAITGLVLLAPHILMSSNPHGTALGGPLGAIGAIGLVALAFWAILPRWQSVVPGAVRGLILAVRDAPAVRAVRRLFGGYDRWRALHRHRPVRGRGLRPRAPGRNPVRRAPVLRWSYVAVGGIGLGFYVYRELLVAVFRLAARLPGGGGA